MNKQQVLPWQCHVNLEPLSVCQFEKTLLCTGTPFVNGCHIRKLCVSFGFVCGFMVHVWALHRKCINQSDLCGLCTGSVVANQILSCYCCY